jgi:hypothetical protein
VLIDAEFGRRITVQSPQLPLEMLKLLNDRIDSGTKLNGAESPKNIIYMSWGFNPHLFITY